MTLKQAYTEWAAIPENTAQAARNRSAMETILLREHGACDVCEFTAFRVRKIMSGINEVTESIKGMKIRTASILVQVLTYAASKGACLKPEFDYTIAGSVQQEEASQQVFGPEISEATEASEPPLRNEFGEFSKGHKPWNAGKQPGYFGGGREKVPVVQLDPDTLQVIETFDCLSDARKKTGAQNIDRAIQDHKMSGGYYWTRPDGIEGFKPGYKRGPKKTAWSRKKKEDKPRSSSLDDSKTAGASQKGYNRAGKHVVQLDPATLEVMVEYSSMTKACTALGIQNLSNMVCAIDRHTKCGGYYWCIKGEEKDFRPKNCFVIERKEDISGVAGKPVPESGSATPHTCNADSAIERTPLSLFSDEELKAELMARGWRGSLCKHLRFEEDNIYTK